MRSIESDAVSGEGIAVLIAELVVGVVWRGADGVAEEERVGEGWECAHLDC